VIDPELGSRTRPFAFLGRPAAAGTRHHRYWKRLIAAFASITSSTADALVEAEEVPRSGALPLRHREERHLVTYATASDAARSYRSASRARHNLHAALESSDSKTNRDR